MIIFVNILVDQSVFCFLFVYAQQCGHLDDVQNLFYDQICTMTAIFTASAFLIPCVECNDHEVSTDLGYNEEHSDCGYGKPYPLY